MVPFLAASCRSHGGSDEIERKFVSQVIDDRVPACMSGTVFPRPSPEVPQSGTGDRGENGIGELQLDYQQRRVEEFRIRVMLMLRDRKERVQDGAKNVVLTKTLYRFLVSRSAPVLKRKNRQPAKRMTDRPAVAHKRATK